MRMNRIRLPSASTLKGDMSANKHAKYATIDKTLARESSSFLGVHHKE
jgi:hypothetical protein